MHPFWLHTLIAGGAFLGFGPMGPAIYLPCVAVYYGGRWILQTVQAGPGHKWFYLARRVAVSLGLSVVSSLLLMGQHAPLVAFQVADREHLGSLFALAYVTGVLLPAWFVVLLILGLPIRFVQWMRKRRENRKYRIAQAEATIAAAEQQRATAEDKKNQARDQQRRIEARAQCDLLYNLNAPEIAQRFPRPNLDQFMATYMADASPAEEVERRGQELRKIIEEHRRHARPEKKPRTIQDLAEWYLREKQRIAALALDDELKQEHLVALDVRYSELSQELLQGMEP